MYYLPVVIFCIACFIQYNLESFIFQVLVPHPNFKIFEKVIYPLDGSATTYNLNIAFKKIFKSCSKSIKADMCLSTAITFLLYFDS